MEKIKLFCLPYAGGSAIVYMTWKKFLDHKIELRPIELAGRGRRFSEPLYQNIEEAVTDIYHQISKELDGSPYALYGHSMGTILVYELLRRIREYKHQEPMHAFFSGRYPPFVYDKKEFIHKLPDHEFMMKIYEHGGTNEEILKNKELLDIFLPVLKADYKIVELYKHCNDILKLDCSITVLNGSRDNYVEEMDIQRWEECTKKQCKFYTFDDGHFFINTYKQDIAGIINSTLK